MANGQRVSDVKIGWGKPCPKCGDENATFHLMMVECDRCINNSPRAPDKYIERNGMLIPNPAFKAAGG